MNDAMMISLGLFALAWTILVIRITFFREEPWRKRALRAETELNSLKVSFYASGWRPQREHSLCDDAVELRAERKDARSTRTALELAHRVQRRNVQLTTRVAELEAELARACAARDLADTRAEALRVAAL